MSLFRGPVEYRLRSSEDMAPDDCGVPRMPYRKAVIVAVSMAEMSRKLRYFELTAVCARCIAEMYVASKVVGEYWGLHEGMWKLPYDTDTTLWNALCDAQSIGNAGAHAQETHMDEADGDRALKAALIIASAYLTTVSVQRSRL